MQIENFQAAHLMKQCSPLHITRHLNSAQRQAEHSQDMQLLHM